MDYQKTLNSFDFQTNQEPTIEESRTATELGIKSPEMPTLLANQEIQDGLQNLRNLELIANNPIPKICRSFWDSLQCASTAMELGKFLYDGYEYNLRKSTYTLNKKERAQADCFIDRWQGVDSICQQKKWRAGFQYVGPYAAYGNYQCQLLKFK